MVEPQLSVIKIKGGLTASCWTSFRRQLSRGPPSCPPRRRWRSGCWPICLEPGPFCYCDVATDLVWLQIGHLVNFTIRNFAFALQCSINRTWGKGVCTRKKLKKKKIIINSKYERGTDTIVYCTDFNILIGCSMTTQHTDMHTHTDGG